MLDETDRHIVNVLGENGRLSMKELGEKVHLTGQAASTRVLKLEEAGVIEGYQAIINEAKMGLPILAFINIYTRGPQHKPYFAVLNQYKDYVQNNYKISGDGCYLVEVRFASNEDLDQFLVHLNEYVDYKLSIALKNTWK